METVLETGLKIKYDDGQYPKNLFLIHLGKRKTLQPETIATKNAKDFSLVIFHGQADE
jgi:hypothetical protein